MRERLSEERRAGLVRELKAHYLDRHGQEIGDLKASLLVDFFAERLGPVVYDQAIQDARKFVQERLDELEPGFYEPPTDRPPAR